MQTETPRRERPTRKATCLAVACAVVMSVLCPDTVQAAEPRARTQSASLSVSATVLRRCTVSTPARISAQHGAEAEPSIATLQAAVSFACSDGAPPSVQFASLADSAFGSAELAQLAPVAAHAASGGKAGTPLVVTVLF